MTMLEKFIISSVSKELNELNFKISAFNNKPLPSILLLMTAHCSRAEQNIKGAPGFLINAHVLLSAMLLPG